QAHLAVARNEPESARRCVGQSIDLALSVRDMPVLAHGVVAAAALRACRGDLAGAAELLGVAEQLRGAPLHHHADAAPLAQRLRAELGEQTYESAHRRGRDLERSAAIALARPR